MGNEKGLLRNGLAGRRLLIVQAIRWILLEASKGGCNNTACPIHIYEWQRRGPNDRHLYEIGASGRADNASTTTTLPTVKATTRLPTVNVQNLVFDAETN